MIEIKLFVDDLRDPSARHEKTGKPLYVPDPENWTWVKTVTEAIRILATMNVTDVSLDHDIMHTVPANQPFIPIPRECVTEDMDVNRIQKYADQGIAVPIACAETYEPIARYIALMEKRPRVRFHTANPEGERKMRTILGMDQRW